MDEGTDDLAFGYTDVSTAYQTNSQSINSNSKLTD